MPGKKVLITGGAGSVGRAVTRRLVAQGWDVRVIGRRPDVSIGGAEYLSCDITQFNDLRRVVRGCQAVVHLAALAGPGRALGQELFRVNAFGTLNVFEAAAAAGIGRVVQASSINALGCFYNIGAFSPRYLPIDEAHPAFTSDPYSFSKQVVEEIGAYYWRRDGISSVALRLPAVWSPERIASRDHRERIERDRAVLDAFAALPEVEQRTRLAQILPRVLALREGRPFEFGKPSGWREAFGDDVLSRIVAVDRYNLWAAIDDRDAAQAVEKALCAHYDGSHVLFVNDTQNWLGYDAITLARLFFPEAAWREAYLQGPASLVSIEQARALIDFEPKHPIYRGGQ